MSHFHFIYTWLMYSAMSKHDTHFSINKNPLPLMCSVFIPNWQKLIIHGAGEGPSSLYILPEMYFTGCILVFEYLYFLLQSSNNDPEHALKLAVDTYQSSGTQATVISSLQDAIQQYGNDHDTLLDRVIIDIILHNQMCMSSLLSILEVYHNIHQHRDF